MTKSNHSQARRLLLVVASLAIFATACGGGGGSGPTSEQSSAAVAAASTNEGQLQLTSDISSSGLLDTADGSITNLGDVVTGDRPVLVWYWSPN